jgi:hypothetical protein
MLHMESDKTLYAWQTMSEFFYVQQLLRDGRILGIDSLKEVLQFPPTSAMVPDTPSL